MHLSQILTRLCFINVYNLTIAYFSNFLILLHFTLFMFQAHHAFILFLKHHKLAFVWIAIPLTLCILVIKY